MRLGSILTSGLIGFLNSLFAMYGTKKLQQAMLKLIASLHTILLTIFGRRFRRNRQS